MTYEKGTCDVCGGKELIAGVASSSLGPCSFCYCRICLAMGADPKYWVEATVECCGGIEHVHEGLILIYFEDDRYVDYRTKETIPIKLKDKTSFTTQTEYLIYHKKEVKWK